MAEEKKSLTQIIIYCALSLVGFVGGVILAILDIKLSEEISAQAEKARALEITEAQFTEFLNSKTPSQFLLTLGAVVLIIVGIAFLVLFIKKVAEIVKAKKKD